MKHFFHNSSESDEVFLLLHGTGGRETDLLSVAGQVDSSLSVLGIRGEIMENGKFRYFNRNMDGSMNEESLKSKTKDFLGFLKEAASTYHFNMANIHLIGYSNGANMAVSLLLHQPDFFQSAILLHPSHPLKSLHDTKLTGLDIYMTAGARDQVVLPSEAVQLRRHLTELGANVSLHMTDYGHEMRDSEINEASKWWNKSFKSQMKGRTT